jgi:hypothetical protein
MRLAYAAVLIGASFMGPVFAQEDIPTDTERALAKEWNNPATTQYCLNALRLYTTNATPDGGFLPSAEAEQKALEELVKGAAGNAGTYKVAKATTDFAGTLAKANTRDTKADTGDANADKKKVDDLFAEAKTEIDKIYATEEGKEKLNLVQQLADRKLKILQLLEAYPKPVPLDGAYAKSLETFRACYKYKDKDMEGSDRLFKLVSDKILGHK